jgi:hypothetical protein
MEQVVTILNELDALTIGLGSDATSGAAFLDIEVTAQSGTKTAQQFAKLKDAKTSFSGLLDPAAAVSVVATGALDDSDVTQMKTMLTQLQQRSVKELESNSGLPDEQKNVAKQMLGDLFQVLQKTVENKKTDGGVVVYLEPGALTVAGGATIGDGAKLDKVVKQLVNDMGKDQPGLAKLVKLDAEKYQGVTFHTVTLPMDDPNAVKAVGKTLDIVVGIGDQCLYIGAGRDAMKTIRRSIDKSKTPVAALPLQMSVSATSIAKFVGAVADDDTKRSAQPFIDMVLKAGPKDHVNLTVKAVPNGEVMRLELEEGVIKVIGQVGQMMSMMMGMPPMGPGGPGGPMGPGGPVPPPGL